MACDHKIRMVEARGVEPLSEDRQRRASTCLAGDLGFRFRPRPPAGLERSLAQCISPAAAEHQRQASPQSSPLPPRGRQERNVTALSGECQFLVGCCCFRTFTSSRSSACHPGVMIPVEAGRPLSFASSTKITPLLPAFKGGYILPLVRSPLRCARPSRNTANSRAPRMR